MPLGVLVPRMRCQVGVFVLGLAGWTSPQSLSSTYWRPSMSRLARATAAGLTEYEAMPPLWPGADDRTNRYAGAMGRPRR